MANLENDLSDAIKSVVLRADAQQMKTSVQELIRKYRGGVDPEEQVLSSDVDVAAYAAYRLPATYSAARAAFRATAALIPAFSPTTHLDVGGGMGAAVWAGADVWPSLRSITVLEQSVPAIDLGRKLARRAEAPEVRAAAWERFRLSGEISGPQKDLATMSYVLGELTSAVREGVVRSLARRADTVVLVEPGTPDGYERIVRARDHLLEEGLSLVAPCPHEKECPIDRGEDWCHFSVRLNRSAIQREMKLGSLGFEDEKYSFVAATRSEPQATSGRILRHPVKRKGLVSLQVCTADPGIETRLVSKREGNVYRSARKASWGDTWPPGDSSEGPSDA